METQLVKLEKIQFHNDNLFCPVINGEPMIIMNKIIKNIRLNYKSQMDDLLNSRFNRFTLKIQLLKDEKRGDFSEIQSSLRWIKIEKIGQKTVIFEIQSTQWKSIFSQIGGYEYVVLPIRKFAAWLYSINPNKVKPEIKKRLEMYQEECDDILYDHFFGPVSKRKKLLIEKFEIATQIGELEKELMLLPIFIQYMNLKAAEMRHGKMLKALDNEVIETQKVLF